MVLETLPNIIADKISHIYQRQQQQQQEED